MVKEFRLTDREMFLLGEILTDAWFTHDFSRDDDRQIFWLMYLRFGNLIDGENKDGTLDPQMVRRRMIQNSVELRDMYNVY